MKFLKNFLAVILILIIVGGVGFIGYSTLFSNHSANNMPGMTASNSETTNNVAATSQPSNNHQSSENAIGLAQSNLILQNKENLDKSIADLKEALKLMTVDPYAPSSNSAGMAGMDGMESKDSTSKSESGNATVNPTKEPGGNNTTINIYPQDGKSTSMQQAGMNMQNMGTTYDPNKMEQLHNGLYKVYVGMALLDQLDNQLVNQAENAYVNTQNVAQYYTNQYNLTAQNKIKLTNALTDINDAVGLININPYVSSTGLVYDKDRMNQIHQSVVKFADGTVSLNQLSDSFTKQANLLSSTVQNYINNVNNNANMDNMTNSSGLFGGLFDNISSSSVVNIILILFVLGLIFGLFGFIFSLLKPKRGKLSQTETDIISS